MHQGQYYLDYLRFSCYPACVIHVTQRWTMCVSVEWSPVPALDESPPTKYLARNNTVDIDKFLPSVQVKKLVVQGKLSSTSNKNMQEISSQFNVDKSTCKSYVQYLEFHETTVKKRAKERKVLPVICWTHEKAGKEI